LDDAPNAAANQAFLAANAKKDGVVSLPGGLQYRVLRKGFGKRPLPGDTVQIYYSGTLINGAVFDGTSPGLPASVVAGNLIPGLAEALLLMHEGDHWQIALPPNLAFGARGASNGTVPPGQAVLFDVTLVATAPAPPGAQADKANPFSVWSAGREQGAMLTLHP
jgi:FKBP-type peptidyl-prolyl cis-trans isomerase FklB